MSATLSPMKAITFTRYGTPDVLELSDVPVPQPAAGELLIRVHASSVNSWDWEFLSGTPFVNRLMFGWRRPRPSKRILGADIAGVVEATGPDVTRFRPGDEVFGDLWDRWGGFAEYACTSENSVERKPATATFEQAAAIPQAGVLALQGLRKGGPIEPGEAVLVNGAGGGVGTLAIQIAKNAGAEVTGVDSAHKLDVIRSVGADHALDYALVDFTKTGKHYDLIVDCQNRRSMLVNRRTLRPGGTYAMVGGSMGPVYQLWLLDFAAKFTRETRRLRLVSEGPNKGLADLGALFDAGVLSPVIDSTYPLEAVPEAMRRFGENLHAGKIAISIGA